MGTWKWKHTEDFAFSQVPRLSQASGVDAEYFSLSQCPEARCVLCSIVAQNCSDIHPGTSFPLLPASAERKLDRVSSPK